MKGNELYERFRQTAVQRGQGPFQTWDELGLWRAIYDEVAAQVTTAVAQADPVYPVTDDDIMCWIGCQSPNVLARLYQILHSMGYRI